jgi:peptidyl-prolyl cis-trans isomerase SurA
MRKVLFVILFLFASSFTFAGQVVEEILAHVGNEIITRSDYDQELDRMRDEMSHRFQGDELQQNYDAAKKNLLDFMISQKLLDQRAKELDLDVTDEVNAAVQRLREENDIPDDQALDSALKKEGTSLVQLRDDFHRRIIQQKILWNYVQGKVNITEDEIKNYYEQHKNEITTERKTKVTRYIFADEGGSTDKATLKGEADSALQQLKAGKELKTGDTPHLKVEEAAEFAESEMSDVFVSAIKDVAVGSFSDPQEITTGYLILKVDARNDPQPIPFEEARGKIYNQLLSERSDKYQKTFLDDLRKQSYVVITTQPS